MIIALKAFAKNSAILFFIQGLIILYLLTCRGGLGNEYNGLQLCCNFSQYLSFVKGRAEARVCIFRTRIVYAYTIECSFPHLIFAVSGNQ